jgi:hypothetical protein
MLSSELTRRNFDKGLRAFADDFIVNLRVECLEFASSLIFFIKSIYLRYPFSTSFVLLLTYEICCWKVASNSARASL